MQRAQIRIADQKYCKAVYEDHGHFIYGTHICAYDPDIRKGSCKVTTDIFH